MGTTKPTTKSFLSDRFAKKLKKFLDFLDKLMAENIGRKMITVMGAMFLIVGSVLNIWTIRQQKASAIDQVRDFSVSVHQITMAGLTTMMISNSIAFRDKFLEQIKESNRILSLRVVRGENVIRQFGYNPDVDVLGNELERRVISDGRELFEVYDGPRGEYMKTIIPIVASDNYLGKNCLACHGVVNGAVMGAVSMDVSLEEVNEDIFLFIVKLSLLGIGLFIFLLLGISFILSLLLKAHQRLEHQDAILQRELRMASVIQRGILPVTPHHLNCMNVVSYYSPMEQVGGDIFDILHLKDGYNGFFIADVSGHGVPAAFITTMAKIYFSEAASMFQSPSEIMGHVNMLFKKTIQSDDYLTAFLLVVSPRFEVFYTNGGHCKAIVLRAGGTVEEWDSDGSVVGVFEETVYEQKRDQLHFGDRVLLCTDGLLEARNSNGEEIGGEAIMAALKNTADLPLAEARTALLRTWEDFTRGTAQRDDVTFMLIELDPQYRTLFVHRDRGLSRMAVGDYAAAIPEFAEALKFETTPGLTRVSMARSCLKVGDYDAAIEHYERYLKFKHADAMAMTNLASAYLRKKDYGRAVKLADRALGISPGMTRARTLQAVAYFMAGQHELGLELCEKILEKEPQNAKVKNLLKKMRLKTETG